MKQVELYAKVRYAVQIEGLSKRAAARRFGIDPRTVDKMIGVFGAAAIVGNIRQNAEKPPSLGVSSA